MTSKYITATISNFLDGSTETRSFRLNQNILDTARWYVGDDESAMAYFIANRIFIDDDQYYLHIENAYIEEK